MTASLTNALLTDYLKDARSRTLELVRDLDADQLWGPRLDTVNPLLWEIGHLAWFHEHFALRNLGDSASRLTDADALYNSSTVAHDVRWDLNLPGLTGTLDYMAAVQNAMIDRLSGTLPRADEMALYLLAIYHEDMHGEAFTYSRQTLGYQSPGFASLEAAPTCDIDAGPYDGDVALPDGLIELGASINNRFTFDNEKWAHPVEIAGFRIARAPVTNAQFMAFVESGGYRDQRLWTAAGWRWREATGADHPLYWSGSADGWAERRFDQIVPLKPHRPVIHVNFYEADAWCRWAGRRLPWEAEWEAAASSEPAGGGVSSAKRCYPWGDVAPVPHHANLDGRVLGPVDVAAYPAGDSAWGCRQMLGNVWEWCATIFEPYPGFVPDVYEDYSVPWFGSRMVLRGGAWATRSRMITNTYRNFFTPERRDIMAGFRTCAI